MFCVFSSWKSRKAIFADGFKGGGWGSSTLQHTAKVLFLNSGGSGGEANPGHSGKEGVQQLCR